MRRLGQSYRVPYWGDYRNALTMMQDRIRDEVRDLGAADWLADVTVDHRRSELTVSFRRFEQEYVDPYGDAPPPYDTLSLH